jgi:hypothetical protein
MTIIIIEHAMLCFDVINIDFKVFINFILNLRRMIFIIINFQSTVEGITNFILQKMNSFDDKTIIVTFEKPITNTIKLDNGDLFNSKHL